MGCPARQISFLSGSGSSFRTRLFSLPALVAELLLQSTTGAQATRIGVSREWLEDIVCRVSVVEGTATAKCVDAFTQ